MLELVLVVAAAGLLYVAAVRLHWAGILPQQPSRTVPRRRWHVSDRLYSFALRHGFRYSYRRDALVLRTIGPRWGPVLKRKTSSTAAVAPAEASDPLAAPAATSLRRRARQPLASEPRAETAPSLSDGATPEPRADAEPAPSSAELLQRADAEPAPGGGEPAQRAAESALHATAQTAPLDVAPARPRAERVVDLSCLPLPPVDHIRHLWQLTAVDTEARFVWAEVKITRGQPPLPRDAADFIREIAADLEARGLQLGAVVVRGGNGQRRSIFDAAVVGGARLLRIPPGARQERVAERTHNRILGAYWRKALADNASRSPSTLRSGLRSWVDAHNSVPPANNAAALPPASALGAEVPG